MESNIFSSAVLINLYHAFSIPYLIYCDEVWGNALRKHFQPLIKLQHKILKIFSSSHSFIHKEQLYDNSGILPFDILVKHRIGLLMHTLTNGNVPEPLLNLYYISNNDIHAHFTRQDHHIHSIIQKMIIIYLLHDLNIY